MAAYGTDDGFTDWLAENGYVLPSGAPSANVLRTRGSTYVDGYEAFWTGYRTGGVMQDRAWPRTGATLNCTISVPADVIPPAVITATYRAAWLEGATPGVLAGSSATPGARVKRQKVDTIEREFFDDGARSVGGGPSFIDSQIDGLLGQFICDLKDAPFVLTLGS